MPLVYMAYDQHISLDLFFFTSSSFNSSFLPFVYAMYPTGIPPAFLIYQ